MKLPKPNESQNFDPCPAGNHVAVCFQLVDLGTQETNFKGEVGKRHEIQIGWEVPDHRMEDGRPFMIGKTYRFSMHEKATLRQHLESWRGREFTDEEFDSFQLENIIGTSCMLQVIHNESAGRKYANIASIAALPKSIKPVGKTGNKPLFFSFQEPDASAFNELSEWMQEKISKSPEYKAWQNGSQPEPTGPDDDYKGADEIPF